MKRLFSVILILILSTGLNAQDVAQWRGNSRNGIYNETGLLKKWPEAGPKLLWSTDKVGDGYGSPVILDGRLYICGAIDSTACLFVFTADGKQLDVKRAPVIIGDNVAIQANVMIPRGLTIGDGAIIGAGTVLRQDIPANSLAYHKQELTIKGNITYGFQYLNA